MIIILICSGHIRDLALSQEVGSEEHPVVYMCYNSCSEQDTVAWEELTFRACPLTMELLNQAQRWCDGGSHVACVSNELLTSSSFALRGRTSKAKTFQMEMMATVHAAKA